MARRRRGRRVDGVLVLDKPQGLSSNGVLQEVKKLYGAQKAGHTGSLDPLATGVLPICFGEATKFSQFLLTSDKRYWVKIQLGINTTTSDSDGEIVSQTDASHITAADIEAVLPNFRGEIEQVPSMYSALKHQGQPLYKLARQGVEVERQARKVTIFSNNLVSCGAEAQVELEIHCSKGTYIRTIAEDMGKMLGVGGHVNELRRTAAGPFDIDESITLSTLVEERQNGSLDKFLRPIDHAVGQWPEVKLNDATAFYLRQGQPVLVPHAPTSGWVRLNEVNGSDQNPQDEYNTRFLGVGEILDDGRVAPRRLVSN